jgi:aldehyde:ferredoxin oxidoreductase
MHNIWDEGLNRDPLGEGYLSMGIYTSVKPTELNAAKVHAYKMASTKTWLGNHLGMCAFIPWTTDELVEMIRGITGWETNLLEMLQTAERGVTMARIVNLREGLDRKDDTLPARMTKHHISGSVTEEPVTMEELEAGITLFYEMMGWDPETGTPTKSKLAELELSWVA